MIKNGHEGSRYENRFRFILLPIAIVLSLFILRTFIADYYGAKNDGAGVTIASKIVPEDAKYHYSLAFFKYIEGDIDSSISLYSRSLSLNTFDSKTWLGLARSYIDKGEQQGGAYAVQMAVKLDPNNPNVIWDAGLLSLINNNTEVATGLLKRYMSMVPSRQEALYLMLFTIGAKADYIFNNIVPPDYEHRKRYLNFLISHKLTKEALDVWEGMDKVRKEKDLYITFCDFLLASGHVDRAIKLWDDFIKAFNIPHGKSENVIWNGEFENSLEGGCLDWRVGKAEGVKIYRDRNVFRSGAASLTAIFNGRTNPDIYIAHQIFPVRQGARYKLVGYMKTENITTKNGVFFELKGYRCEFTPLRTEPQIGTIPWERLEIDFSVPAGCETMMVGIRRERSDKFDNKISGDVWIDSVSVREIKN